MSVVSQETTDGLRSWVAIDWSFSGIGGIGQDLGPLLYMNRRVPNIFDRSISQYGLGLGAAGWQGNTADVSWSAAISAALTYGVAMVGLFINNLLDEREHQPLVDGFGDAIEQLPQRARAWIQTGLHFHALAVKHFVR